MRSAPFVVMVITVVARAVLGIVRVAGSGGRAKEALSALGRRRGP